MAEASLSEKDDRNKNTNNNKDGGVPLPDVVVIGLQEAATGAGALVLEVTTAFAEWNEAIFDALHATARKVGSKARYKRVAAVQMVGLVLLVIVRQDHQHEVRNVRKAVTRTGPGALVGNKGAVAVRATIYCKRFLFITGHFAPHDHQVAKRNQNYFDCLASLVLDLPDAADDELDNTVLQKTPNGSPATRIQGLRFRDRFLKRRDRKWARLPKGEQLLRSHDYVFFFGDLNYRLTDEVSHDDVVNAVCDEEYLSLLQYDELRLGMSTDTIFHRFHEPPIDFPPTYKYDVNSDCFDSSRKNRKPGWTDRILYRYLRDDDDDFISGTDDDNDTATAGQRQNRRDDDGVQSQSPPPPSSPVAAVPTSPVVVQNSPFDNVSSSSPSPASSPVAPPADSSSSRIGTPTTLPAPPTTMQEEADHHQQQSTAQEDEDPLVPFSPPASTTSTTVESGGGSPPTAEANKPALRRVQTAPAGFDDSPVRQRAHDPSPSWTPAPNARKPNSPDDPFTMGASASFEQTPTFNPRRHERRQSAAATSLGANSISARLAEAERQRTERAERGWLGSNALKNKLSTALTGRRPSQHVRTNSTDSVGSTGSHSSNTSNSNGGKKGPKGVVSIRNHVTVRDYRSVPSMRSSDHRPVSAAFTVGVVKLDERELQKVLFSIRQTMDIERLFDNDSEAQTLW